MKRVAVPSDVKQHYRSDRVSISPSTKSSKAAIQSAQSISQRLEDYWAWWLRLSVLGDRHSMFDLSSIYSIPVNISISKI